MSNKTISERLLTINRGIIAIFWLVLIAVPFFIPMSIPIQVNKDTRSFYNTLIDLPDGSTVYFSMSIWGSFWPQLGSAAARTINILWMKDVKIMIYTLSMESVPFLDVAIEEAKALLPPEKTVIYGEDYVTLGLIPGGEAGLAALTTNIRALVPKDVYGNDLDDLLMMKDINTGEDFDLIIHSGVSSEEIWGLRQVQSRWGNPLITIAVQQKKADFQPYLLSGQMSGAIFGLSGTAQLELISKIPGPALVNTNAISFSTLIMVFLLLFANIVYLYGKSKGEELR